ncbi:MAG: hypothetical protein ABFS41_00070 [Myxococcota bacterium]
MSRTRLCHLTRIGTVAAALLVAAPLAAAPPFNFDDVNKETRPIPLGSSGGNINDRSDRACCSGTLGSLVQDAAGAYILSNNHVIARNNQGVVGEDILQPGLIDQGPACTQDGSDAVADLTAWAPLSFDSDATQYENTVDAAIAAVRAGEVTASGEIADVGIPSSATTAAAIGMAVQKRGRTSGHTFGTVGALNVTVDVTYPAACGDRKGPKARFVGQIRVDDTNGDFSEGGDSGSLVVTHDAARSPVGLLFAGSKQSTLLNPIDEVLGCLQVVMAGDTGALPTGCSHGVTEVSGGGSDDDGGSGGPPPGRGKPSGYAALPPGLEVAAGVQARHEAALFAIAGVAGTGISTDSAGYPVIEVYLESAIGDPRRPLPMELEGIPVRRVVTGPFVAE